MELSNPPSHFTNHLTKSPRDSLRSTADMAPLLTYPPPLYLTHPPAIALLYAHSGITSAPQHASSPGRYAPTSASSQGGLRPRVRFS
ncbi:hypothetical protein HBH75_047050 [Parastagonospora nodorum]|nr:hypothetical protein HBH75_047050 [Parastagonospora nodorum]